MESWGIRNGTQILNLSVWLIKLSGMESHFSSYCLANSFGMEKNCFIFKMLYIIANYYF